MLPFCHVTLRGQRPYPLGYPKSYITIGDHIRKGRIDLRLFQREVAERLGVDEATIYLWESNRVKPSLSAMPKIVKLLGYMPYEAPAKRFGAKIQYFRRVHGLSQKKLACLLKIDQSSIGNWERGEKRPIKRNMEKLLSFLTSYPSSSSGSEE